MATAAAERPAQSLPAVQSAEAQHFALQQRQATMFAMSPLVPEHLRKGARDEAVANCYIALKLAEIMGEAPLIVMQNIHVVKGKAGFAAQYMIARANKSGVFKGRIGWDIDKSDPENLSVTAHGHLSETGERVEFTADMAMAKAEGWTANAKYKSMPELMLRYRSATFLVRLYAPDVMLGYQTAEEVEDVVLAAAEDRPAPLTRALLEQQARDADDAVDAAPVEQGVDTPTPDNPTGEEGPAPQQRGEATPEWAEHLDAHLARVSAAANVIDLNAAISDFTVWLDDLPEDERARVIAAEREASDRLNIASAG